MVMWIGSFLRYGLKDSDMKNVNRTEDSGKSAGNKLFRRGICLFEKSYTKMGRTKKEDRGKAWSGKALSENLSGRMVCYVTEGGGKRRKSSMTRFGHYLVRIKEDSTHIV